MVVNNDMKVRFNATLKALDRARKAGVVVTKLKDPGIVEARLALSKALDAFRAVDLAPILRDLRLRDEQLALEEKGALERRRESLRQTAQTAGWTVRRRQGYDFVGCFRVDYKGVRVSLQVGSEAGERFDEVDGERLFERIKESREQLESFPFSRPKFLDSIKYALRVARAQGIDRDGRVGIKRLYPLVVLTRHTLDGTFMKRPGVRNFTDYSLAQFAFDLARFVRGGAIEGGVRLRNQPPNMASIEKRATLTLPSFDRGGGGEQIGVVWIENVDES